MDSDKAQEIEARILKVGDQASVEAAQLLQKITDCFLAALEGKAGTAPLRRKSTMESNWDTEIQIWPKSLNSKPKSWDYTMGASLLYLDGSLKLLIWVWSRNAKISPAKIIEKYKNLIPNARFNVDELNKKSVHLNILEIKCETKDGRFSVDQDPILEFCKKTAEIFAEKILPSFLNDYA